MPGTDSKKVGARHTLYYGDNLDILRGMPDNSVDLIYIDPPFNSKRDYNVIFDGSIAEEKAFEDTWSWSGVKKELQLVEKEAQRYSSVLSFLNSMEELLGRSSGIYSYLVMMSVRVVEMHRVLSETGTFYLHCDPTASHYLKVLLDHVFGEPNFRNEIIWCYSGGGIPRRDFPRKHDVIFRYTKSDDYVYNPVFRPYTEGTIQRGRTQVKGKYFERGLREAGTPIQDWWTDINPIHSPTDPEKMGYPTQKPIALLERIISVSSKKDDVVLDTFCGCGTTVAAAEKLGRRWIGVDITFRAIDLIRRRLTQQFYGGDHALWNKNVKMFGVPMDIESAAHLAKSTDPLRKEFEKWSCTVLGGVFNPKLGADGGYDGFIPFREPGGKMEKCLVQVKSGGVGIADVQRFNSVLEHHGSPMGVFFTLQPPSKNMKSYVSTLPEYRLSFGPTEMMPMPRLQIITVEEYFGGKRPLIPMQVQVEKDAQATFRVGPRQVALGGIGEELEGSPTNGDEESTAD